MSTFKELIRQVKSEIQEVSVEEARLRGEKGAVLVDVRETDEWSQGHVPGSVFIPRGYLEQRVEEKVKDKAQEVILYCAGGTRSAFAAKSLAALGYSNVSSMIGGFGRWKEAGFPIVVPKTLSAEQKNRYSRHLLVPEVGEAGQARLLASKALLIGAGGLGSPAGLYLAAAGVGTIGIVDSDVVDLSNLQRQVLHTTAERGQAQDRVGRGHDPRAEPGREGGAPRPPARGEQRDGRDRALRRDRRRLRQLPHQVPRERRRRALRQDQRLRQHLPVRRTGVDLRGPGRPLLPVPLPGADSHRAGAVVRRGGRAGRAAGGGGPHPGHGGAEVAARQGRAAEGPAARLRRPRHDLQAVQGAARSQVRGLRRRRRPSKPRPTSSGRATSSRGREAVATA